MLGIMGAMPEEINDLIGQLTNVTVHEIGQRNYYEGKLWNKPVVIVFSRWGKVAAASTVTTLILKFNITELIFTGVAGAIHPNVNIGDIVIGKNMYQHDMDARPLMAQFEIPLSGKTYFETDVTTIDKAQIAANQFLKQNPIATSTLQAFNIHSPKVHIGDIASGDQFFAHLDAKIKLHTLLPSVLCVEMEGAAVAQVCHEFNINFLVIRTISDSADHQAPIDFPKFIRAISNHYSMGILKALMLS
jgi:adenosylhomocysteine nucleosidase